MFTLLRKKVAFQFFHDQAENLTSGDLKELSLITTKLFNVYITYSQLDKREVISGMTLSFLWAYISIAAFLLLADMLIAAVLLLFVTITTAKMP